MSQTVLVLDDDADRRFLMTHGLRKLGVGSDEASTLEEAIRHLNTGSYDMVVCDVILCEPPGADNPASRGYLAVCYALARSQPLVVQASTHRHLAHRNAILSNFRVDEVANILYGARGITARQVSDGGCPWYVLEAAAAASRDQRYDAAMRLAELPIVREVRSSLRLDGPLGALEDAADGAGDWSDAVAAVRHVLFPGAGPR